MTNKSKQLTFNGSPSNLPRCCGKISHPTEDAARAHLDHLNGRVSRGLHSTRQPGRRLDVYCCPLSGFWHVGHHSKMSEQARVRRNRRKNKKKTEQRRNLAYPIYAELLPTLDEACHGKFIAINLSGGAHQLGETAAEALRLALLYLPTAKFYTIRIDLHPEPHPIDLVADHARQVSEDLGIPLADDFEQQVEEWREHLNTPIEEQEHLK